eukprot:TRINITY_DN2774_c0_g1_i1.p1 TRINITY_DN2774_c0_g1~~TRINITY_DN2774_c0_g1_i1.p1  ORF type:complete len:1129 (+),score=317.20 TRINITY_DN2774_c0_g1_i1:150-3536(+)
MAPTHTRALVGVCWCVCLLLHVGVSVGDLTAVGAQFTSANEAAPDSLNCLRAGFRPGADDAFSCSQVVRGPVQGGWSVVEGADGHVLMVGHIGTDLVAVACPGGSCSGAEPFIIAAAVDRRTGGWSSARFLPASDSGGSVGVFFTRACAADPELRELFYMRCLDMACSTQSAESRLPMAPFHGRAFTVLADVRDGHTHQVGVLTSGGVTQAWACEALDSCAEPVPRLAGGRGLSGGYVASGGFSWRISDETGMPMFYAYSSYATVQMREIWYTYAVYYRCEEWDCYSAPSNYSSDSYTPLPDEPWRVLLTSHARTDVLRPVGDTLEYMWMEWMTEGSEEYLVRVPLTDGAPPPPFQEMDRLQLGVARAESMLRVMDHRVTGSDNERVLSLVIFDGDHSVPDNFALRVLSTPLSAAHAAANSSHEWTVAERPVSGHYSSSLRGALHPRVLAPQRMLLVLGGTQDNAHTAAYVYGSVDEPPLEWATAAGAADETPGGGPAIALDATLAENNFGFPLELLAVHGTPDGSAIVARYQETYGPKPGALALVAGPCVDENCGKFQRMHVFSEEEVQQPSAVHSNGLEVREGDLDPDVLGSFFSPLDRTLWLATVREESAGGMRALCVRLIACEGADCSDPTVHAMPCVAPWHDGSVKYESSVLFVGDTSHSPPAVVLTVSWEGQEDERQAWLVTPHWVSLLMWYEHFVPTWHAAHQWNEETAGVGDEPPPMAFTVVGYIKHAVSSRLVVMECTVGGAVGPSGERCAQCEEQLKKLPNDCVLEGTSMLAWGPHSWSMHGRAEYANDDSTLYVVNCGGKFCGGDAVANVTTLRDRGDISALVRAPLLGESAFAAVIGSGYDFRYGGHGTDSHYRVLLCAERTCVESTSALVMNGTRQLWVGLGGVGSDGAGGLVVLANQREVVGTWRAHSPLDRRLQEWVESSSREEAPAGESPPEVAVMHTSSKLQGMYRVWASIDPNGHENMCTQVPFAEPAGALTPSNEQGSDEQGGDEQSGDMEGSSHMPVESVPSGGDNEGAHGSVGEMGSSSEYASWHGHISVPVGSEDGGSTNAETQGSEEFPYFWVVAALLAVTLAGVAVVVLSVVLYRKWKKRAASNSYGTVIELGGVGDSLDEYDI